MESPSPNKMILEIITPDAKMFNEEIDFLLARALDGSIGILPKHIPLVAALKTWPLKIKQGNAEKFIAVFEGFMQVEPDKITILTDHCEMAESIDIERAKRARQRAIDRLKSNNPDIDMLRAEAALMRAVARLKTTGVMEFYAREMED